MNKEQQQMVESAQSFWSSKSKVGAANQPSQTLEQMEREVNAAAQLPPKPQKEDSIRNLEKEFEQAVESAPKQSSAKPTSQKKP